MRQQLRHHPDSRFAAVTSIDVEVVRTRSDRLELSYIVTSEMNRIRMPAAAANARGDGLWRHTCFEAFVRTSPGAGYYELNFSPSGQWAVYQFSSYRSGMRVADEITEILIELRSSPAGCTLQASLDTRRFAASPADRAWRLGLSAVIEDTNGGLSYWALAHAPGKADFHHADNFTCEISPAVTP